ncbi:MAG: PA domain-containing protein, partial [Acidimicrobiales bacterium]
MTRTRGIRRAVVAAAVLAGVLGTGPSAESQATLGAGTARSENINLVGFNDLGGAGLNGDLAVIGNTVLVAAGITPDTIPNQGFYGFTVTYPCPAVTVKVVDLSEPTRPTVVATIPVPVGVAAVDVDAVSVRTPTFTGDLAAVALASCGGPASNTDRGVAYYDVTIPARPEFLGRYFADFELATPTTPACGETGGGNRCAQSERSVALVQRADGRVLSLSTQPFASGSNFPAGDMRIVDVTNPRNPTQVGSWPNLDQVQLGGSLSERRGFSRNGCRPIETGRGVAFGQGGQVALLANQDLGMFTVDIANPAVPTQAGHAAIYPRTDRTVEGTAGYVTEAVVGDRRLALLAEEDWIAPTTRVRIDAPSSLAGSKFACEAMFTLFDEDNQAQVYRKPGAQIAGEMVYVGRGCPASATVLTADPLLGDVAGKIAVMDHTRDPVTQPNIVPTGGIGCGYDIKVRRAQDAGATAVIMRRMGAVPEALSESGGSAGLTIPMVQVDTVDGDALRATLCPGIDAAGACTGATRVTGAITDTVGEWGGLNIIDNTEPASPRSFPIYRTPTSKLFPPPDLGVYAVRHAVASGNRALVAAY